MFRFVVRLIPLALIVALLPSTGAAQMDYKPPPDLEPIHRPYDQLLDAYVRDGIVYYHALQLDRAKLDRYVASLSSPALAAEMSGWNRAQQIAFWINAYNALALQTAVQYYPRQMNQVPGGFDQLKHTIAGKTVTLAVIETSILAGYNDPRIF